MWKPHARTIFPVLHNMSKSISEQEEGSMNAAALIWLREREAVTMNNFMGWWSQDLFSMGPAGLYDAVRTPSSHVDLCLRIPGNDRWEEFNAATCYSRKGSIEHTKSRSLNFNYEYVLTWAKLIAFSPSKMIYKFNALWIWCRFFTCTCVKKIWIQFPFFLNLRRRAWNIPGRIKDFRNYADLIAFSLSLS